MLLAANMVWHFWLAVVLALSAVAVLGLIIGLYVTKVSSTRYPKSEN